MISNIIVNNTTGWTMGTFLMTKTQEYSAEFLIYGSIWKSQILTEFLYTLLISRKTNQKKR